MKRFVCFFLLFAVLLCPAASAEPLRDGDIGISAPSAILMEKYTGEVLYEKNAHERIFPASVTKVMTMLLIVEDIESGKLKLDDTVTASARAASFGGSCVYLEEGEQMSVDDMLKCIAVVSANDCAVAMAEHISGTEQLFVERMNKRAEELGLEDTHFTGCTGLFDDGEHYTSAYDVAVMSRASRLSRRRASSRTAVSQNRASARSAPRLRDKSDPRAHGYISRRPPSASAEPAPERCRAHTGQTRPSRCGSLAESRNVRTM